MTVDRYLRMIAGGFILLSLALGHWVHPYWYFLTAFVGQRDGGGGGDRPVPPVRRSRTGARRLRF